MSTNFNVIQAQRDLAVARNNELQAQLDYQLALITYETVQLVGGASTASSSTPTVTIPDRRDGRARQRRRPRPRQALAALAET